MKINSLGHLEVGGCDTVGLAKEFGTPLFVYDVALIRNQIRHFRSVFLKNQIRGQIAYAGKAFSSIAILQLILEEGMALDVVSGGELYTALKAGFPPEKIHFHGNNKSPGEISFALDSGIGYFIVDNFHELELLEELCRQKQKKVQILLRITPGVSAHTHHYILTGNEESKFGFSLLDGQAKEALQKVLDSDKIVCHGVHFHIGSQIFETDGFILSIERLFHHLVEWKEEWGFEPKIINAGGGFGIRYTNLDQPLDPEQFIQAIIDEIKKQSEQYGISFPEVWIEPGRSIVGEAGITLYTIGTRKDIPGVRTYLSVDGGMTDNLRPALYGAKYDALVANKALEVPEKMVTIAGRTCESGDILIENIPLAKTNPGDLLAVFATGAYGYAMANNYNRLPRPAVVFVENGKAKLVVKRETYEDLIRNDLPLYD